jgi:DNA-binding NarL/FixJ family response regulator
VIRVVVADDQHLVRGGFRLMLDQQPDLEVVAEAADGREAVRLSREHRPDVVLMDIRMPVLDGIAATEEVLRQPQPPKVLVLTTFDVDDYVVDALRLGASGYLLKDVEPDDLVRAVRSVVAGDTPLAPVVLARLVSSYVERGSRPRDARLDSLSDREREVLGLLGRGLSNAEIRDTLVVSLPTVKTHVANVLVKLGLRDRVQAAIYAHEQGVRSDW